MAEELADHDYFTGETDLGFIYPTGEEDVGPTGGYFNFFFGPDTEVPDATELEEEIVPGDKEEIE
jgi:hypothetical protein